MFSRRRSVPKGKSKLEASLLSPSRSKSVYIPRTFSGLETTVKLSHDFLFQQRNVLLADLEQIRDKERHIKEAYREAAERLRRFDGQSHKLLRKLSELETEAGETTKQPVEPRFTECNLPSNAKDSALLKFRLPLLLNSIQNDIQSQKRKLGRIIERLSELEQTESEILKRIEEKDGAMKLLLDTACESFVAFPADGDNSTFLEQYHELRNLSTTA